MKQLGRGVSETTVSNGEEVDAALLAKIRTDGEDGPEVDAWESGKVFDQLGQAEVDDVVQAGDSFRVTLRVLGGTTAHLIAMPSAKDVAEHKRSFLRALDMPFNKQEITVNLGSAGVLYKKLVSAVEGYAGEVPIIHQVAVLKAAIEALEVSFQEDQGANF